MSDIEADWGLEKDPTDDEIRLLYEILRDASFSTNAPFKAFFAAYDDHFARNALDKSHDNVIYRLGMRVVHAARKQHHVGKPTNLVPFLTSLLEAHGITCIEDDDADFVNDDARSMQAEPNSVARRRSSLPSRRASFDDARLEETWLSEHSRPLHASPAPANQVDPPRGTHRSHDAAISRRTRSASIGSDSAVRHTVEDRPRHVSSSTTYTSEPEEHKNPTLLFKPSQTQLEENAEAFAATTQFRHARHFLHIWHDRTVALHVSHTQAENTARLHDRRMLMKQSLDVLQERFTTAREEKERTSQLNHVLAWFVRKRDFALLVKVLDHWNESVREEKRVTSLVQLHMMKVKYFGRWRRIAVQNAEKARIVLCRKYLTIWRARVARRLLANEQANAHYEETLLKRTYGRWFWSFCSRQVEGWHETRFARRTLRHWQEQAAALQQAELQALKFRSERRGRMCLGKMSAALAQRRDAMRTADCRHEARMQSDCLQALRINAKVRPMANMLSTKRDSQLKVKVLAVWALQCKMTRQAAEVDSQRLLRSTWTEWNDTMRCRILTQQMHRRLAADALRKMVLEFRLRTLQREKNARLAGCTLNIWRDSTHRAILTLDQAEAIFASRQTQRRLRWGMLQLHQNFRAREHAERSAVEFANARNMPRILATWHGQTQHLQKLQQWAADARFFCLGSRTLHMWHEQTTAHQHERRREAYRQIRARVKTRLARTCLMRWSVRTKEIQQMQAEAQTRAKVRLYKTGTDAFDSIRDQARQLIRLHSQAIEVDKRKLLLSALVTMLSCSADLAEMQDQVIQFRYESDLVKVAAVMKKLQWAHFTSARRIESADALWARNRDQHVRQMLKHWALQAVSRRNSRRPEEPREAESPSLRPASRMAARSVERPPILTASVAENVRARSTTPGYMATPSRSRRASRFRPLPTPAAGTPMTFDTAYLSTTPAPPAAAVVLADPLGEISEVFDTTTPDITPFSRKLRAGGVTPRGQPALLRSSVLGRSILGPAGGGTNKSVRFVAQSRFANVRP